MLNLPSGDTDKQAGAPEGPQLLSEKRESYWERVVFTWLVAAWFVFAMTVLPGAFSEDSASVLLAFAIVNVGAFVTSLLRLRGDLRGHPRRFS